MGIKFHCPNGHKLNVKSFLAGKRGICPKCHVRMRIPLESESEVGVPVVASTSPKKIHAQSAGNGNGAVATETMPLADEIQSLLDDPERIWHMSAEDGAQFGPASGAEMMDWLAEDRVLSNSHVWCDSWEDWRIAGDVFPQLRAEKREPEVVGPSETTPMDDPFSNINPQYLDNTTADSVIGMPENNPFSTLIQPDPESSRTASRRPRQERKPSHGKAILLGLVAIASLAALVFIFMKVI